MTRPSLSQECSAFDFLVNPLKYFKYIQVRLISATEGFQHFKSQGPVNYRYQKAGYCRRQLPFMMNRNETALLKKPGVREPCLCLQSVRRIPRLFLATSSHPCSTHLHFLFGKRYRKGTGESNKTGTRQRGEFDRDCLPTFQSIGLHCFPDQEAFFCPCFNARRMITKMT